MTFGFKVGNRLVGGGAEPFIIAEMSGNHNQSLDRALEIATAAARSGAHALKLQTYTADTMTLDLREREFVISDPKSLWNGRSLYDLYKEASTPWEWHAPIIEHCRKLGLIVFSTPFDESAVDFLESLGAPCYKVASFELVDLPLIEKMAATGKPLIMSTGMASVEEIEEAVSAARGAGCENLILLKCTSSYPSTPENSHIRTISDLKLRFGCEAGLSDHTRGIGAAVAAVALGAAVIEKHFTLSRADGGVDSAFSMEPEEMADLVRESRVAWQALGNVQYGTQAVEEGSRQFRRSIYIVEDVAQGSVLTEKNIRRIRPGFGLPPKHYSEVLGRKLKRDARKGTPLSWDIIE